MSIPVGATHVVADIFGLSESSKAMNNKHPYRKHDGKEWLAYVDGEWCSVCFGDPARYQQLQKSWSGPEDGLPPIGTVFKFKGVTASWKTAPLDQWREGDEILVISHQKMQGSDTAVYWNSRHQSASTVRNDLLSIAKTPEQLAAEERERAVNDLASEISGYFNQEDAQTKHEKLAKYLLDQGFKREVK